jgi:hypothetical protein
MSIKIKAKKAAADIGEVAKASIQGMGTGVKIAAGFLPLLVVFAVINRI